MKPKATALRSHYHIQCLVCVLSIALLHVAGGELSAEQDALPATSVSNRNVESGSVQQRLLESVRYLASDELEGRGVGTDGLDKAAVFIAEHFERIGLDTELYGGTPFDHFRRTRRIALGSTNTASITSADRTRIALKFRADFLPLSLSTSGNFDLPLVFAGYGITAPSIGYDDYAGIDVQDKAVILLRHEPRQDDPDSPFDGTGNSDHAYFARKITNAVEHGAAAVILCTDMGQLGRVLGDRSVEPTATALAAADELLEFRVRSSLGERRIPVLHCKRRILDQVIGEALGTSLAALEQLIDDTLNPQSVALPGCTIAGEVSVLEQNRTLKNVAGLLQGNGTIENETIVVGAHYDHLGLGGWGSLAWGIDDEVHNGADDNGSGTAVLMEVAYQLASQKSLLNRDVLFMTFTAEEMGLVGSEHYVRDPLIPIDHTIAMFNLDMVGRLRKNRMTISGTGTAAEFDPLVDKLADKHGLRVSKDRGGYGPSDHASFYGRGVPVLHFFTGLHPDYHRPSDDYDKLNLEGMERIAQLVADAVIEIANADQRPKKTSPFTELLDSDSAPKANAKRNRDAWLGVSVDKDHSGKGFAILSVAADSAAVRAGLRANDVVLRFEDQLIEAPTDLVAVIAESKPDQTVTLGIRRGSVEFELDVVLGTRP